MRQSICGGFSFWLCSCKAFSVFPLRRKETEAALRPRQHPPPLQESLQKKKRQRCHDLAPYFKDLRVWSCKKTPPVGDEVCVQAALPLMLSHPAREQTSILLLAPDGRVVAFPIWFKVTTKTKTKQKHSKNTSQNMKKQHPKK